MWLAQNAHILTSGQYVMSRSHTHAGAVCAACEEGKRCSLEIGHPCGQVEADTRQKLM
jgi:hypothetical protein